VRQWEKYKAGRIDTNTVEGVPNWLTPAIDDWINNLDNTLATVSDRLVLDIKTELRIDSSIGTLHLFLKGLRATDPDLFFAVIDYIFAKFDLLIANDAKRLTTILFKAGHKYTVTITDNDVFLTERLPEEQRQLLESLLSEDNTYKSEFTDAFIRIYGREPDPTAGTGEAFQALESALKFYLGEDKGNNLGAILGWLKQNRKKWSYNSPSEDQNDAGEHFLSLIDFVNKSYRKTKHGQAMAKLKVSKTHAEVVLRATALLIHELENVIQLTDQGDSQLHKENKKNNG
jgi:hypothetical protein